MSQDDPESWALNAKLEAASPTLRCLDEDVVDLDMDGWDLDGDLEDDHSDEGESEEEEEKGFEFSWERLGGVWVDFDTIFGRHALVHGLINNEEDNNSYFYEKVVYLFYLDSKKNYFLNTQFGNFFFAQVVKPDEDKPTHSRIFPLYYADSAVDRKSVV